MTLKKLIRSRWFLVIGTLMGALAGYLYYKYVGCITGTCSITSKPLNSTIYGALMGGLGFSILQPSKIKKEEPKV